MVIFMGGIRKPDSLWDSRYLWMPLRIGDGKLWLPKPCEWTIDVATGEARLIAPTPDVPEAALRALPGVSLISAGATYTTSSRLEQEPGSGRLLDADDGTDPFAFHTQNEPEPNVVVDLKREWDVLGMAILNRSDGTPEVQARASTLAVWLSDDGIHWRLVWKTYAARPVWSFALDKPERARYVKIGLRDTNFLHLKRVRIYGR